MSSPYFWGIAKPTRRKRICGASTLICWLKLTPAVNVCLETRTLLPGALLRNTLCCGRLISYSYEFPAQTNSNRSLGVEGGRYRL